MVPFKSAGRMQNKCPFPVFCNPNEERGLSRTIVPVLGILAALAFSGATCNSQVTDKARKQSEIHLELSQNYMKEGDLVSARREALLAVEKDPANYEAHYALAYVFGQMDDYENGIKHARLAIKHADRYPEAQNLLGVLLMNNGNLDEAIEVLVKLTEDFLYPTPHLAYGNLGQAYCKKGEYDKAVKALKKAVQLQPLFCLGYYRLGVAYSDMERYKDALESLETCVSIEDQWGDCARFQEAFILMGDIRMKLDTPDLALEDYSRCFELNPNNATGIKCKKKMNELKSLVEDDSPDETEDQE
jgi:type IV pilus assembly protein PilF